MNFLKCIYCNEGSVEIFAVFINGSAKSKCMNCGLSFSNDERKDKIKKPEVIYK